MISLDEALAAYPRHVHALEAETIPLTHALHRVLRSPARARCDLPRFSQSAMDGYAVTLEDAARVLRTLTITDAVAAGDTKILRPLKPGECQRILTGARLPPNTGAVVAQERVSVDGGQVQLSESSMPRANIRWQGEELRAGAAVGEAGQRLTPGLIASLASAGVAQVEVSRAPRIAVLVSGDELRPLGAPLAEGQIWDSNGPLVTSWLQARGYAASQSHLSDSRAAVETVLNDALSNNDLVITTGGVSVGDKDFIIPAAEALGVKRAFWRVAQKPGKPIYFGLWPSPPAPLPQAGEGRTTSSLSRSRERVADGRERARVSALLGLPGNPGAVLVGMTLHARAILDLLEGAEPAGAAFHFGSLAATVKADAQRERLVRMRLETDAQGRNLLHPLPHQDSHMLSNMSSATVLARLPARELDYATGETVRWTAL